ncbi:MFS transporter [Bradyrhizobium sp. CIAT3101]|uniref:MFS transporter n=1 Tax=Bradyrhizobium sp. CIAT3101 TaxID=439387 RepID=UPI0024B130FE|nr:MFS transporter [Bradyrhizobium sp. CIAT3101]WFU83969.1 MFS transporter [Bradyrhizobium sp. CIAT3101]
MAGESQIPIATSVKRRFAVRLALFYSAVFAVSGTHLPFFPVWLKAVGVDAAWIGIINALPGITRFTTLPYATAFAEKRHAIRAGMMVSVVATAAGFALVGLQHQPLALLLLYALTCIVWTPVVPLTDAYALRGVIRYGFDYGPVRLWGSAAFAAGALACGYLVDSIATRELIWIIVAWALVAAVTGLLLQPLDDVRRRTAEKHGGNALLRDAGFWLVIISAALIQGSHAAYYSFSAISWQAHGLGGFTIAGLWTLGVIAEIVVFALSPRFSLHPSSLMAIGGVSAVLRWIVTAQEPSLALLTIAQLGHGLTFGMTIVGTMNLLVQRVPSHQIARGQGYYAACSGVVGATSSIASGAIYAHIGDSLYYVMAAMAAAGALLIWAARRRLIAQPQSEASGG